MLSLKNLARKGLIAFTNLCAIATDTIRIKVSVNMHIWSCLCHYNIYSVCKYIARDLTMGVISLLCSIKLDLSYITLKNRP